MKSHPAAELLPMMAPADLAALIEDIKVNGQREPITIYNEMVLDGRHRYAACQKLGIEPMTKQWDGNGTAEAFVLSMNLWRRHLTESQRAVIAAKIATRPLGSNQHSGGSANLPTQAKAAEMLNVSERSVRNVAAVIAKGVPEMVQAIERGDIKASLAAQLVSRKKEDQKTIATAGGKLVTILAKKSIQRSDRRAANARRKEQQQQKATEPKETQHDRDLRWLQSTWAGTCESARAAFVKAIKENIAELLDVGAA